MKKEFTYDWYRMFIQLLQDNGYLCTSYENWKTIDNPVILRHDIDMSLEAALKLAEIEKELGVQSTYFVLITSDFYNPYSKKSINLLNEISKLGHSIGLHFDETRYEDSIENPEKIVNKIKKEASLLGDMTDGIVKAFSYHRPSQSVLDAEIEVPGLVNSYSSDFFKKFKYLSDSRRNWKEPVVNIISSRSEERLHILTHAFWYRETAVDINESVKDFVMEANAERWESLKENIRDLDSIMERKEVIFKLEGLMK